MKNWIRSIILGYCAVGLFAGAAGAAAMLVPHRAVYEINLVSARTGSGISSVKGEMLAEWTESCEGWALDHRTLFDISYGQGGAVRLTSSVATWESRDGLLYHFDVTNAVNGKVTEKFEGRGRLDRDQGGGRVDYVIPEREPLKLAPGTVFPMIHTARVLAATRAAPTIRSLIVFDGMSEEGVFRVNAVIGKPIAPTGSSRENSGLDDLKSRRSWPLQLAYFSIGGRELEPKHEVGMRIYENGVGNAMLLDFGDFKVMADLKRLEYAKRPSCGGK